MSEKVTYEARDHFAIIRRQKYRGRTRGLVMPDVSAESTRFVIESVGKKVEHLAEGDEVMIIGKQGEEYLNLPGEPDLLVIDARFVPYVIHRSEIPDE